jgi:hypothetical protein
MNFQATKTQKGDNQERFVMVNVIIIITYYYGGKSQ